MKNLTKTNNTISAKAPWTAITRGRASIKPTSDTWINILAVPSFSTSNKYVAMVNCMQTPVTGSIRNDGRLIAWGSLVSSGATYTVDYIVFKIS